MQNHKYKTLNGIYQTTFPHNSSNTASQCTG